MAHEERHPPSDLIFHSDRGAQYTFHRFQQILYEHNTKQSFSPLGKPHDNAVAESFFASLKKKSSTARTILPIEHFKPALLPILSFIIANDLITYWKIWRYTRWKRVSVQLLNETSVFESPDLFVFYYTLRQFAFSCLIFDLAWQRMNPLSCQGF